MRVNKWLFHEFIKDNGIKLRKGKTIEQYFTHFTKWLNQVAFRKKSRLGKPFAYRDKKSGRLFIERRMSDVSPMTVSLHVFRKWVNKEKTKLLPQSVYSLRGEYDLKYPLFVKNSVILPAKIILPYETA